MFWVFFSCLLKWVNLSIYDSGQCLGKNLTNAKEMPILENSKYNNHLGFPKHPLQPILIQQKGWKYVLIKQGYIDILIADCYSATEILLLTME